MARSILPLASLLLISVSAVNYGTGESDWAALCREGTQQSPIDIEDPTEVSNSEDFKFIAAMQDSVAETVSIATHDNKWEFAKSDRTTFGFVNAY
jgi:carbonic anhydrase